MDDPCPCCSVMVVKDLNRWFKEKWVDVSRKDKDGKHPPCGRKKANTSSKGYPKCRPSVKVSSKTPKTSGSMSEGQKRAATKRKRSKKQGVGGKPTIVKGMSDDEREDDFQTQLHLAQLTDQKRDESVEQYHQRMANTCPCGSGQTAVPNAHFEEPRCMTCIREQTSKFMSQMFQQEEQPTIQTNPRPDQRTHPYSAGRYDQYPFGYDFSQKNAGEVMDMSWRLLKRPVSPEAKRSKKQGVGGKPTIVKQFVEPQLSMVDLSTEEEPFIPPIYPCEYRLPGCEGVVEVTGPSDLRRPNDNFIRACRPCYDRITRGYDGGLGEPMIATGEPMDMSWRLLKRPVSPEAKRHKLEYDTKYESTPERLKYREELKRERRHRGIDGKGGPDMSHTKNHTLVAEDPHTNRARHFKERGTLKGDPMNIAWRLLKGGL